MTTTARKTMAAGAKAILATAAELFSERGYAGTSINTIATAAGTSKANIFHHFGSKEGLFLAVLQSAAEETAGLIGTLEDSSAPADERVAGFCRGHLRILLDNPQPHRLVLREMLEHGDERGLALANDVVGDAFARLVALIREGRESGGFRSEVDPTLAATLLVGANVFFFQTVSVLRHLPEVDFADQPERFSDGVIDLILNGLSNPPTPGAAS